jgi:C_GCAxxG_C_C family probable redox protein
MKTRSEAATEKFLSGYNCAQSVLWSFSQELLLDPNSALKVACGFGAGIAQRQEVCGAVTGGIMVLGLKYGRGEGQDRTATEETYAKIQELMHLFETKHGTCNCRQLLGGCDFTTEEGRNLFKKKDLLNHTCKACVQSVVAILEDIIPKRQNKPDKSFGRGE